MARLRVFISSTCYDFDILRGELRPFIVNFGYEPVMSEYSDVLFDPRSHTHDSCLKDVPSCDMVVLIVGSRFGGTAVPSAIQQVDFASIENLSTKTSIIDTKEKLSITQLEVLKAVEAAIPVYAFVDERVLHDHNVYEKNKDKLDLIDQIEFPSIQKRESAKYIFEFINFLSHRTTNNSILAFSRLEDIRAHLASQWSQLFQRLLLEGRTQAQEARRYRDFSERIDDLKAVVLASLATPDLRDTAKGAVQFRRLIGFVSCFTSVDSRELLLSDLSWEELLEKAGIIEIRTVDEESRDRMIRPELLLVREDRTFYSFRLPRKALDDYRLDWSAFQRLDTDAREAIVDALLEDREYRRFGTLRYIERDVDEFLSERAGLLQLELGGESN